MDLEGITVLHWSVLKQGPTLFTSEELESLDIMLSNMAKSIAKSRRQPYDVVERVSL